MTYQDAITYYGTDAPDLRYDLKLVPIDPLLNKTEFNVFKSVLAQSGTIKAICIPQGTGHISRKVLDSLTELVKPFGIQGVAHIHLKPEGPLSPIAKFLSDTELKAIISTCMGNTGDSILMIAHPSHKAVNDALHRIRGHFARELGLIKENDYKPVWITDFPLFEKGDNGDVMAVHHPFTSPHPDDMGKLESDPFSVRARAYDIVLNGSEIGGGSIRIHNPQLQDKIFQLLGLSQHDIDQKFGFFIEALNYGTPPHGGIALGLDRVTMLLSGASSIREVIAFPKTTNMACPLTDAPSQVNSAQLNECHIKTDATPT